MPKTKSNQQNKSIGPLRAALFRALAREGEEEEGAHFAPRVAARSGFKLAAPLHSNSRIGLFLRF